MPKNYAQPRHKKLSFALQKLPWSMLLACCVACAAGGSSLAGDGNDAVAAEETPAQPMEVESGSNADNGNAASSAEPNDANAPNNPNAIPTAVELATISKAGDGSATIGPNYSADANMSALAGVAKGRWCQFVLDGTHSKFYTGVDPLLSKSYAPIKRNVYVYIPPGYVAGTVAPVLIEHDAQWARGYLTNVLDNLIAKKALPQLVAIAIDNGGGDSKGSERGLEYDVVSGKFGLFIDQEVLPMAESNCQVKISKNPALRAAMGLSSSGAAAIGMGWWHPELYSRLITFSATMVAQFPTSDQPVGAWIYPSKLFANTEKKDLRIFLAAGQKDNNAGTNGNYDFLLANRNAAAALAAKGYNYKFYYGLGAGHVDSRLVNQTLPTALAWAWRGWEFSTP